MADQTFLNSIDLTPVSAFAKRLANHLDVPPTHFRKLAWSDGTDRTFSRGQTLYREGDEVRKIYVVHEGWAIGTVALKRGRRFVYRMYQAGDIIALEDMNWSYASTTVEAVTDLIVSPIDKFAVIDLVAKDPKLGTAIIGLAMLDQVVAMDRARSNSRSDGPARLAHLLLQLEARAKVTDDLDDGWFDLPLTQNVIADALGQTPIHINRSLKTLFDEGLIEREKRRYRLIGHERLVEMAEFINRYIVVPQSTDHLDMGSR